MEDRDERVRVIGADPPPPTRPTVRSAWVAVALTAGILAIATSGRSVELSTTTTAVLPLSGTVLGVSEVDAGEASIEEVVPGFAGSLVIVSTSRAGDSYLTRWSPGNGPPEQTVALPGLLSMKLDAGGTMLAGITLPSSDRTGTVFSIVDVDGVSHPVEGDPKDFAWHASVPGLISWLSEQDSGEPEILVRDADGRTHTVGRDGSGSLAAWGDWGFAFVRPSVVASTELFGPDLDPLGRIAGIPIGRMPDGRLLFSNGHGYPGAGRSGPVTFLVHPATGRLEAMPGVAEDEAVLRMSTSPSRELVALHVVPPSGIREDPFLAGSIRILSVDGDVIGEAATNRAIEPLAWSTDGRYVVFPLSDRNGNTQLAFRDTGRDETIIVRSPYFDTRPHFPILLTVLDES